MKTVHFVFGVSLLCLTLAKPSGIDKTSNEEKLQCVESNDAIDDQSNTNLNSVPDLYKPRSKFEGSEKYSYRPFDERKRSLSDDYDDVPSTLVQKRQVGVIYKDDRPIGILQPYKRSYRFIPVKEENLFTSEIEQAEEIAEDAANIDKREVAANLNPAAQRLDESYPSILTNFKIDNKLDKKRNYDAITDDNVKDLKATIRKMRSSNPHHNNEQIEEQLKNILDDMGLIDDEEIQKREVSEEENQKDDDDDPDMYRNKRDETFESDSSKLTAMDENKQKKSVLYDELSDNDHKEISDEPKETSRKKRQKENNLLENLKESGDLTLSGNKSPLASSSEINTRDVNGQSQDSQDDYDKRVERQIQSKISSLKEEVKREIEALKAQREETQRKKRQVTDNLADEETDALNPAMNYDGDLKSLIRKRRTVPLEDLPIKNKSRKKREISPSAFNIRKRRNDNHSVQQNYHSRQEENEEAGELLGDDVEGAISKREVFATPQKYAKKKYSRSFSYENSPYNRAYFYDDDSDKVQEPVNEEFLENERRNDFFPQRPIRLQTRRRRRINKDLMNRPQQLSDMSDIDLFGALPKSYDGELSRYKRVRRN